MQNQSDNKNLEIKFGGSLHEIDADLFIESLLSYSIVAQEAAAYLSPSATFNIKIKAPKEGSFIMLLKLIANNSGDLFTRENISMAAEITVIVGGLYGFKKWIAKNGKPELIEQRDDNSIEVRNKNGSVVMDNRVYNIYQTSPRVRENLRKTFSKLQEEEEIIDFSIKDKDEEKDIFYAPREDFPLLASDMDEVEQKKQKVLKDNQELSVFKVVFQENYKWEFYYQGNKIYASLKDDDFFAKIEKGEVAFRSGDRLFVNLEIEQIFNESANIFVNEAYNIVKVLKHIPRTSTSQPILDFENIEK